MTEKEFYLTAALYAMQGMQEIGGKLGILAELLPKEISERAFTFADEMLEEAKKRKLFD